MPTIIHFDDDDLGMAMIGNGDDDHGIYPHWRTSYLLVVRAAWK